ncbi:TerB family tellurite resistance protein [Loktanella sp. R86503]|uniref:TerB family tellurite resistance protein n=1 Tax=Loktanella sp. R86503 TaxID=3093847 RepID=UPI0036DA1FEB
MTVIHTDEEQVQSFDEVEQVVADTLRFKRKLAIGGDAYASIRIAKSAQQIWDVGGIAATGGGFAASSAVASTFFASGGFMSAIGLGAAAVTPVGWVIGAAVASGGAYYGVTRLFRGYGESRVEEIPKFINTPIDLLGASLMDMLGAFAMKVAAIDGVVDEREITVVQEYFVKEWGFDRKYTQSAIQVLTENAPQNSISEMTKAFASFAKSNRDCNFEAIRRELLSLLTEIAEADGKISEQEELVIDKVAQILDQEASVTSYVREIAAAPSKALSWATRKVLGRKAT